MNNEMKIKLKLLIQEKMNVIIINKLTRKKIKMNIKSKNETGSVTKDYAINIMS